MDNSTSYLIVVKTNLLPTSLIYFPTNNSNNEKEIEAHTDHPIMIIYKKKKKFHQSAGAVEYTDVFSAAVLEYLIECPGNDAKQYDGVTVLLEFGEWGALLHRSQVYSGPK